MEEPFESFKPFRRKGILVHLYVNPFRGPISLLSSCFGLTCWMLLFDAAHRRSLATSIESSVGNSKRSGEVGVFNVFRMVRF